MDNNCLDEDLDEPYQDSSDEYVPSSQDEESDFDNNYLDPRPECGVKEIEAEAADQSDFEKAIFTVLHTYLTVVISRWSKKEKKKGCVQMEENH